MHPTRQEHNHGNLPAIPFQFVSSFLSPKFHSFWSTKRHISLILFLVLTCVRLFNWFKKCYFFLFRTTYDSRHLWNAHSKALFRIGLKKKYALDLLFSFVLKMFSIGKWTKIYFQIFIIVRPFATVQPFYQSLKSDKKNENISKSNNKLLLALNITDINSWWVRTWFAKHRQRLLQLLFRQLFDSKETKRKILVKYSTHLI